MAQKFCRRSAKLQRQVNLQIPACLLNRSIEGFVSILWDPESNPIRVALVRRPPGIFKIAEETHGGRKRKTKWFEFSPTRWNVQLASFLSCQFSVSYAPHDAVKCEMRACGPGHIHTDRSNLWSAREAERKPERPLARLSTVLPDTLAQRDGKCVWSNPPNT